MKSAFIAVVGRPNTGKSTLINAIVGTKVSIVSEKPQTTRNVIKGIYNAPDVQLVFLDTPGFHKPNNKLDSHMNGLAVGSTKGADLTLYLSDLTRPYEEEESQLIEGLRRKECKAVLVLTKCDLSVPPAIEQKKLQLNGLYPFVETFPVSCLELATVNKLVEYLIKTAPEGPFHYDTDKTTDSADAFNVAETIREQALRLLRQEVPHALAVTVEKQSYDEAKKLYSIKAALVVEKESQKSIVIGKGGLMAKAIGTAARKELEKVYDAKVFLELFVKVERNWRDDPAKLKELEYG